MDPISAVLNVADTIITRLFPDPAQAANAKLELIKLQQSGKTDQHNCRIRSGGLGVSASS